MNCQVDMRMKPFAFRTHAHSHGVVITGYKYTPSTGEMTEFARGNPQWPQAFYPVTNQVTFEPGDYIVARCTFNTTDSDKALHIASTHDQEMCNLYVMYYLEEGTASQIDCANEEDRSLSLKLPSDSDKPLPPNPELELKASHGKHHHGHNLAKNDDQTYNVTLSMPGALPKHDDSYLCSAFQVKDWGHDIPVYIKQFSVF